MPRATCRTGAGLVAAAAIWAGCGGADQPGYCQDRDDLQAAISGLADVDVAEDGVGALTEQLGQVRTDASALVRSTQDEFGDQAAALRSAVAALGPAIREAASDPSKQTAGVVADRARAVEDAFTTLSHDLQSSC